MAIALQIGWHGPDNTVSPQSSHSFNGGGRKRPWNELDSGDEMLQLMMGQFDRRKQTLDLLGGSSSSSSSSSCAPLDLLELEPDQPLPCGWEKCLDLKTGAVYYMNSTSGAKTLNDPRESTLPSSTTKLSSIINLNDRASTLFRNKIKDSIRAKQIDDSNLSPLVNLSSSMETIPPHMLNSKPKCEEKFSLHGAKLPSLACESKLSIDKSMKKTNQFLANKAVLDSGLELKLNLSTFKTALKDEKPQKVSLFMSESTSSPHSIWSLQARENSVSAIHWNEAGIQKVEDNHHNNMMVIVGCPCCLMYVMLWKSEPTCPKCGNFVINADFPSTTPSPPHKLLSLP